jgi:dTDP-glucose 4,6-dehydratase
MKESEKYVLITGGAGFIGSNFIRHLYESDPEVRIVNFDILSYAGNLENLEDIQKIEQSKPENKRRYFFVQGDICNREMLEKLFTQFSFEKVIHFAAESHVDRSIFSDSDFIRTNVEGTRMLVEFVRKHAVPRFVHISTDEVYGSIPEGTAHEDSQMRPSNPYAASKASADLLIQSYMKTFRLPAVIVRGSNNYGTYQYPEKLIPLAITNLIEEKHIPIHGDGGHARSWLHVSDFCRAIDLVSKKAPLFSIYNVSGEEFKNIDVLNMIARHLDKDLERYAALITDRPGADFRYAPSSDRLQSELGWKRTHLFKEAIPDIIDWYIKNDEWWKNIRTKKGFLDHYERQSTGQWC